MKEKIQPGAQWTARRGSLLLALMALLVILLAPVGRSEFASLPPLDPLPPADMPNTQQGGNPQAATVNCTGTYCSYMPMIVGNGDQQRSGPVDRTAAVALYRQSYLPSESVPPDWTGNVGACSAGTTSQAFRDAVLARINYFRVAAGVPALEGLDDYFNQIDQQAALMMSANGQLSHTPPESWKCYTTSGKDGAGSSNLFLGSYGPNAITGYMRDPGAGNVAAGHRRWILYPQNRRMGSGDIPGGNGYSPANALRAWDNNFGGPRPNTRDPFVAWPPKGYVPYQVVFARWSFAYPGANFDSATVTVTHGGASVPVTRYAPAYGYGENTLVWLVNNMPDSAAWPRPSADDPYVVTIKNVNINSQVREFTYTVTVIDPQ